MLRGSEAVSGSGTLEPGRLTWRYAASPTPLSRSYDLRLDFRQGDIPRIIVEAPDLLALSSGRDLPHVYEQAPPRLCLYLPGVGEWASDMRLDRTVIPWSVLWLFYFEEWLLSGDWKGGGMHPSDLRGSRSARRRIQLEAAEAA
ncbi:MAG: hypothetical protein ACK4SZ_03955 [Allosphingosinicella sp.]|uniref:hypothetical protein n=1 Tax=Allosphingosinicella sp. TaxID=2823234 RepID=UPI0039520FA0